MTNIVLLPPYVEPEYRPIIEQAEKTLEEYDRFLLGNIEKELLGDSSVQPHLGDIEKAERMFHENPVRQYLIKQVAGMRAMFERPRFLVKNS